MKVLVVGGGGREHALVWKIKQSRRVEKVLCVPGNAGIAEEAECVQIKADDLDAIVETSKKQEIELVVVGPEGPLVAGLSDRLVQEGVQVFGCSMAAAELEGSKAFAKEIMQEYKVPTAAFGIFDDPEKAKNYIQSNGPDLVVKADGLAAGKGVIVCQDRREAEHAVDRVMVEREFGDAGDKVVIEERLFGEEASFIAFTDGEDVLPLASSQDHKAIYDGDQGPNTGGMGAYSPAPVVTDGLHQEIMERIMKPVVAGMKDQGRPYRGVLYAGLMIGDQGPQVLEFNVRFGDPETQPLLFRMKSDIMDYILACVDSDGSLKQMQMEWDNPAVCVVMASKGYPGKYDKGHVITGLEKAKKLPDTYVFHAGTARKDSDIVTAGGRVLGVTARGKDIKGAIDNAYAAVREISWNGAYYRTDIGRKAL